MKSFSYEIKGKVVNKNPRMVVPVNIIYASLEAECKSYVGGTYKMDICDGAKPNVDLI